MRLRGWWVVLSGSHCESMRLQKRVYLPHCEGNPFFGLLPWEYADLGLRREKSRFHGNGVWVSRDIVWKNQDGRLARPHEIARYGKDEIGVRAVHLCEESIDHRHRNLGPALAQFGSPSGHVVLVEEIRHLLAKPAGLRQNRSND